MHSQTRDLSSSASGVRLLGEIPNVVVISIEFCSLNRFAIASDSNRALIESMMGKFVREAVQTIKTHDGKIDSNRYGSDHMLCYWFKKDPAEVIERSVSRLARVARAIGVVWQNRLDDPIEPKGIRVGASFGTVIFLDRGDGFHGFGDAVNKATQLQMIASANTMLVSNGLYIRHFNSRNGYHRLAPGDINNIDVVAPWRRDLA